MVASKSGHSQGESPELEIDSTGCDLSYDLSKFPRKNKVGSIAKRRISYALLAFVYVITMAIMSYHIVDEDSPDPASADTNQKMMMSQEGKRRNDPIHNLQDVMRGIGKLIEKEVSDLSKDGKTERLVVRANESDHQSLQKHKDDPIEKVQNAWHEIRQKLAGNIRNAKLHGSAFSKANRRLVEKLGSLGSAFAKANGRLAEDLGSQAQQRLRRFNELVRERMNRKENKDH